MSQVQGVFGLLDFTMLLGAHFENYEPFISLILNIFLDHGKLRITETADTESVDRGACLHSHSTIAPC
jgi:hypothetical protein